ncbi:MAG: DUF2834 domain-containing protein [Actinomycetota bacterium]|nr:DUF2834 domain-containing protein [Actinomycetota bacterium]
MSRAPGHKALCWIYGLAALGALIATWSQNIRFFLEDDNGGLVGFVEDSYANAASSSITNDLIFMLIVALVLMLVEARRLGIRHVWVYLVLSFTIAISVAFPLFLLARERKLAELENL